MRADNLAFEWQFMMNRFTGVGLACLKDDDTLEQTKQDTLNVLRTFKKQLDRLSPKQLDEFNRAVGAAPKAMIEDILSRHE